MFCLLAVLPNPAPLRTPHPVQDKNFYLLGLLERNRASLEGNPALATLAKMKRAALHDAAEHCGAEPTCYVEKLKLSDAEIATAEKELRLLHSAVEGELRESGVRIREADQNGADLVGLTWRAEAAALNRILDIYGLGKPPTIPKSIARCMTRRLLYTGVASKSARLCWMMFSKHRRCFSKQHCGSQKN